MSSTIIQSAVNVSEGRRSEVIAAVVDAAGNVPGIKVADWSADIDHNRMVISLLGGPDAIRDAAIAITEVALDKIDLRTHAGVHPRVGAVDVIPLVPIRNISMEECISVSREISQSLASRFNLPVYLYERSGAEGRQMSLPAIRKGGFEGLFTESKMLTRRPDYGPLEPHSSAGAAVVGARSPLVAYNILLDSSVPDAAIQIAEKVRKMRGTNLTLTGVRTLGLLLPSINRAQVSMNLTQPALTPLPGVFDFVREEANRIGVNAVESEIIGLIPTSSLGGEEPDRILWKEFKETQLIDYWLERL